MINRASSLVLILANLIPLAGVVLYGWDVLSLLLLYWAESVVIGVINVARMVVCDSGDVLQGMLAVMDRPVPEGVRENMPRIGGAAFKFILIPFFVVHYGGFCYAHLMVVIGVFSGTDLRVGSGSTLSEMWQNSFWIAVAAIFASHLFSFFKNYIGDGEYKRASLFLLMRRPYGRIIAMHLTIILGAGLVMWLGSALPMLLVLIAIKSFIDLRLHEKERVKFSAAQLTRA